MPHVINMRDAKTKLSRLVQDLESGAAAEFIIARNGQPATRLAPLASRNLDRSRRIGVARGRFVVADDIESSQR